IVRLNQVVYEKDKEIKTFKKQLLKQQVQQLFTIIEIDKK
ncbi:46224_t:CDS:1, partial [Gigaspora margarita]